MYLNAVLAAIVFLVLFEPLQTEVETRIHQFFFRERYDLETSVAELRKRLAHVLEIDEMVDDAHARASSARAASRPRRSTSATRTATASTSSGSIGAAVPKRIESLDARGPLLDRLEQPAVALARGAGARAQQVGRRGARGRRRARHAAGRRRARDPRRATRAPSGLIFVADDRVRDAFTPEEIALLETVASQIGVVVANSRIYSRMKERDRLAALGSMAAGLAHEVKNPLGAIKGAAQLLEEVGAVDPGRPDRARVRRDHPRGGQPPRPRRRELPRLRAPARGQPDPARHERRRSPHGADPLEPDHRRRRSTCTSTLSEPLPRTRIDPEKFRQVLMNLMQNAIQAMDGQRQDHRDDVGCAARARARVPLVRRRRRRRRGARWSTTRSSSRSRCATRGRASRRRCCATSSSRSSRRRAQGTGLGLAISQSIVQNAGGTIEVHSQPGAGTTFTIVLPVGGRRARDARARSASSRACLRASLGGCAAACTPAPSAVARLEERAHGRHRRAAARACARRARARSRCR